MRKYFLATIICLLFYSAAYSGVVYYDDPIAVGIGARPVGMGRAFVAIADDGNAIFMNPGGLGSQKHWNISTMSTNFLNEYQYSMLSAVYPTENEVFGLGYVSSSIGDIILSEGGTANFYNYALVASYARPIGKFLAPYIGGDYLIYGGANFKYYSKGFSGDLSASGAGINFDTGLKWKYNEIWSFGLTFQNMLMGSKVSGDFAPEDMPFVTKVGAAYYWNEYNLKFALDKDMFIGRNVPWPFHVGVEWSAHPILTLRAGFDQVAGASGGGDIATNTTFGVGLEYSGAKIDLAYMQNFAETNIASTFLSISFFGGPLFAAEKSKKEEEAPHTRGVIATEDTSKPLAERVTINLADKIYTFDEEIDIAGHAETGIADITIDNNNVKINDDGNFSVRVPLAIGEHEKDIQIRDKNGQEAVITRRITRLYIPTDMIKEDLEGKDIDHQAIYTELYKYFGKDYPIRKKLSRQMVAMILAKAKNLPLKDSVSDVSKDIGSTYWAVKYIEAVKSAGIMNDFRDGTFKPDRGILRIELTYIMSRATGVPENVIGKYLAGRPLNEEANIADLSDIIYNTGIIKQYIDEYKGYSPI